jgi:hypothetical protein
VRGNGTVLQRNRSRGGTGTAAFDGIFGETTAAARVSIGTNWYEQTFSAVVASRATERLTSTQQIDTDMVRAIAEVRSRHSQRADRAERGNGAHVVRILDHHARNIIGATGHHHARPARQQRVDLGAGGGVAGVSVDVVGRCSSRMAPCAA